MSNMTQQEAEALIEEVLEVYPEAAREDRAKHVSAAGPDGQPSKCVTSNRKSVPGVMTQRGCAYAGSRGVVYGPVKDMIHLSHGPVGCGQYSRAGRRHYYSGHTGVDTFTAMNFTSDFQEKDIVFGGDPKLEKILDEIEMLFPLHKGVTVQSECPIGLIGDDIDSVSKSGTERLGKPVVPVRCEGFRGVSQSLGHHIANDTIRDHILGNRETAEPGPYDVAIIGDYNIGGDCWASRMLLEEMGLNVVAQWSGDGTLAEMERTPAVQMNLLHCYRSMNYICEHMKQTHGIPYMEFNFFGPTRIAQSLREIAQQFDQTIQDNAEKVIAKYQPMMDAVIAKYRPRLEGRKVMIYVGGLRSRHVIGAYEDLGMEVIGTGYEFAHDDDYTRTYPELKEGTLIYDDATAYELEKLCERLRPDLVAAGIKEKYVFQKMGLPMRQMHSWDYSGPYHGYDGFSIFARDMDMTLNNPVWDKMTPPWKRGADEAARAA